MTSWYTRCCGHLQEIVLVPPAELFSSHHSMVYHTIPNLRIHQGFIRDFILGGGGSIFGRQSMYIHLNALPILRVGSNSISQEDGIKFC